MEELRLSLLIMGGCLILAILAHGLWSIRKNKANDSSKARLEPRDWQQDDEDVEEWEAADDDTLFAVEEEALSKTTERREPGFDELGLGPVRVVSKPTERDVSDENSGQQENASAAPDDNADKQTSKITEPPQNLYGSVVTNPKPHMVSESRPAPSKVQADESVSVPEPPPSLLKQSRSDQAAASTDAGDVSLPAAADQEPAQTPKTAPKQTVTESESHAEEAQKPGLAEQARRLVARNKPRKKTKASRKEPNFGEDQMRIDFDEQPVMELDEPETDTSTDAGAAISSADVQQEVLVLSVKAPDDKPISGAALLPMLLTLGFKFGDQDIFHRHVNSNGKGPVLFSLANMFKPGVFDIDNLENFTTQGISLFMILPIEGDPHQVFNMMHNAARKIADEFGAQVLDGTRSMLTKQSLQQYVEKIREFERQRMIQRNRG